jgi:linearmycin/streptolysin S transport system permease protein
MKTLTIIGYGLRRVFRYRANIFFLLLFPLILILVLGVAFGGSQTPKVGVVSVRSGPLGANLVSILEHTQGISVRQAGTESSLLSSVQRGELQAGLVIPAGYDATIRAGGNVQLSYLARSDQMQLGTVVSSAVARQGAVLRAARLAAQRGVMPFGAAASAATAIARTLPEAGVTTTVTGKAIYPSTLGRFDLGASSELVLFVFLMAMIGSVSLIEARRLGVVRRMLSTPTSAGSVVLGEGLGRFAVAMIQGLTIMIGSALIFGVRWGDPLASGALLTAMALVGASAGVLMGSALRTEQQAVAIGLLLGLGLGALGGCMVPIDVFPPVMQRIAHLTPQAWALSGLSEVIRHGGHIADVLLQLGVLLGLAGVLGGLAAWRLRRVAAQ